MATYDQTKFRQDMPPEGGYGKIYVQRTFPRINSRIGKKVALGLTVIMSCGMYKWRANRAAHLRWQLEENDTRMVTRGFYLAERDRLLRDEERDVMKDVPGWRIGTFYGEPIYYTLPPNMWWDPAELEANAHASYYTQRSNCYWRHDTELRGGPKWYDKYLPHWLENL